MISKAIGNILISNQGLVNAAEAKIIEAGKNKVQEEALKRAPNIADLLQPMGISGINNNDIIALAKNETTTSALQQKATININLSSTKLTEIDNLYNKLKGVTTKINSQLESFQTQINSINQKLEIVDNLFQKADEVFNIINPILPLLKTTIPLAANAAIAASSGPVASGAIIDKAQKSRDRALGIVSEVEGIVLIYQSISTLIKQKLNQLKQIIQPALNILQQTINFINGIIQQLDALYTLFLSFLTFSDNPTLEDAGTNVIDSPSTGDLGDILTNLPNSNSQKVFEELGNTPKTGYRYRNIPSSNTP